MSQLVMKPIQPIDLEFGIVGFTSLIQHAWSASSRESMRLTSAERRKQKKKARNPEKEAMEACHWTADGQHGMPLLAIKASIIEAAHKDYGIEKTTVRKGFFVPDLDGSGCVPLTFERMEIREDVVRVGMQQTDLRYRPEFHGWRCVVRAQMDGELLTCQNIIDLVNRAGFSCGIGEWRPQKGGEHGRFEFDTAYEVVQTVPEAA